MRCGMRLRGLWIPALWLGLPLSMVGAQQAPIASRAAVPPPGAPQTAANPQNPVLAVLNKLDLSDKTELGFLVFETACSRCHGNPAVERAPALATLMQYPPERIYQALATGTMASVIGNQMSDPVRRAVAESLAARRLNMVSGDASDMPNRCPSDTPLRDPGGTSEWNGWGGDIHNTRFQTAAAARLRATDVPYLKLKWAFGLPGSASAYGRTAMTIGAIRGRGATRYAVYFGDLRANLYALDARTGQLIWKTRVETNVTDRITAAPTLYAHQLYVPISSWEEIGASDLGYECCKSVGAVARVDADTGRVLWKTYVIPERPRPLGKNASGVQQWGPAGGSVWNSPTVDTVRHALYFGTGDATTYPAAATSDSVMALDLTTGRVLWTYQVFKNDSFLGGCLPEHPSNCPKVVGPDWDIPASPVLTALHDGRRRLIVATKPGDVLALDPDHGGSLVWRVNVLEAHVGRGDATVGKSAGMLWGFAAHGDTAYFGLGAGGAVAVRLTTGKVLWRNPLESAQQVSYASASTGFPGVILQGASNGKLHALVARDGRELWSFDTLREFATVNKVKAKGGSISVAAPVVAGGMLFVGSGYGVLGGTPGNVLLAFAADTARE